MKTKTFPTRVVLSVTITFLLVLIVLVFTGSIIGNVFSNINSSLSNGPTSPADEPTAITSVAVLTPTPPGTATPGGDGPEVMPAVREARRLTLEYPRKIKAGAESDIIRLTLEVDSLGNIKPTANVSGHVVEGEVIEIPNLYDTHNVTAEAVFDIAGLEVRPPGVTFQPLKPGERLDFFWSVSAQNVGTYRGTIWLYLDFESRSSGEKSRVPVSAQLVEIEAVDFFGFSINFVRTSGVVGSILGVVVGFPFFEDIVKYLWGRMKKESKRSVKRGKKT